MKLISGVMLVCALLGVSAASEILVVCPMPTQSHANLFERLVKELLQKGHHVTYVSAFPQAKPIANLTEITIPNLYDFLMDKMGMKKDNGIFAQRKQNKLLQIFFIPVMGPMLCETLFEVPVMMDLMKSDRKFELIIGESFLDESLLGGLSWKFKAPLIAVQPFMPNFFSNFMVGNPAPSSYIPETFLGYTSQMTFLERTWNAVFGALVEIMHRAVYMPRQDAIFRKVFEGEEVPPLASIIKNTSLVLVNHHYSLAFPRPNLPNVVEIAGYHVAPPKPLPKELKKYFDESKEGVILFSLGSHIKSAQLPKAKRDEILTAFSKMKQDVLWKFEDDTMTDVPKNVKISKWVPQSDILAHPNLKLFITHGGLLSTTETVHRGVPVVGIPIMGDQMINMKQVETLGVGVSLDFDDLTGDTLLAAVNKVLGDPSYRENAKLRSEYIRDTPLSAMDTALYWIEYVIRHKGAPHLRSAAQDLAWYQLYLLDVIAVLGGAAVLGIAIQVFIVKKIVKKICCRGSCKAKTDTPKKNN